jgi:uncharacterized protein YndB with AHSA1/START domain/uncharacterized protein YciI
MKPLHRQVVVRAGAGEAFHAFTGLIGSWWPMENHSVYGTGSVAAFRDGKLIETGPDGEESVWGTVLAWEPPRLIELTWHPGRAAADAGEVRVSFEPVTEKQTMVTVTHSGWQSLAQRDNYKNGWPAVLGSLASRFSASPDGDEPVWLVLQHTAGVERPMEHPGFAGHPAFLSRLQDRGVLVAAGPFPGSGGEGMTIVRVPASGAASLVIEAGIEDSSVASGILEVRVRPWHVVSRGSSIP